MQKKLIALAIAGLASSAAFAQSNVTVYGRADYGYETRSGNDGLVQGVKSKSDFRDGVQAGSRIGFKGAEDLGNGLKAIFETEFGVSIAKVDTGSTGTASSPTASSAFWTNRHSYVGLTGNFGTAVGGHLDGIRYNIYLGFDQLSGGVGNFTSMTTQYDRVDNAIAYISPDMSGFKVTLAHATTTGGQEGNVGSRNTDVGAPAGVAGKPVGNMGDNVLNSIMIQYDNGPLALRADYETTKTKDYGNSDLKTYVFAASYDFGVVKVSGLYDSLKGDPFSDIGGATFPGTAGPGYDKRAYLISAIAPIGQFDIKATYGKIKNKLASATNADASKWGIGLDYNLSKRTQLYTDYGHISNNANAGYSITASPNSNAGYGVTGFDIGMAHKF